MSPPTPGPLPVTVVGGYLGAGKTTLVNHLLRHADGRRLAVLVNDFGALPIDSDLIEGADGAVLAIAGGCVCCAYGSDLIAGLETMAARRPRPDHVVVETSGVALPDAVAQSVQLLAAFRRDAIVVLADAETVRRHAADRYMADTIARQLAASDIVVVNKTDLVPPAVLAETLDWAAAAAPHAAVLPALHGAVPVAAMLGPAATERLLLDRPAGHDRPAWRSVALPVGHRVDAARLAAALAAPGLGLVRAKGIVPGRTGPETIQVTGRRWTVAPAAALPDGAFPDGALPDGRGRLVAIAVGRPLAEDAVRTAVAAARLAEP
ncbi:GTP-binding protein [Stella sp.]|uniref:CobW family GTP-binding protein n=1 Tax=Stella sp. TaxID=2912054 RepID=UPI0035B1FF86